MADVKVTDQLNLVQIPRELQPFLGYLENHSGGSIKEAQIPSLCELTHLWRPDTWCGGDSNTCFPGLWWGLRNVICTFERCSPSSTYKAQTSRVLSRESPPVTMICHAIYNDDWSPTDISDAVNNFTLWVWASPELFPRISGVSPCRTWQGTDWGQDSTASLHSCPLVSPASGWVQSPGLLPPIC